MSVNANDRPIGRIMDTENTHPKARERREWDWKYAIVVFGSGPGNGPSIDALNEAEDAAREAVGGDRSVARLTNMDAR